MPPFCLNLRKTISIGIVCAFLFDSLHVPIARADGPTAVLLVNEFHLPAPGVMVHLSPEFNPPILKGVKVHPENPFRFDFILDKGDSFPQSMSSPNVLIGDPQQEQLKTESTRLIKYFLASLTIPEEDLWVNLSPYEKHRIIPPSFGLTEMGRDLLAEDYMLKQVTASLIYPEGAIGKRFWKRIYEEAARKYGTTNVAVNTFNKVWILPAKAVVYENVKAKTAYVVESKLKVMLEEDYLSFNRHSEGGRRLTEESKGTLRSFAGAQDDKLHILGSQILREIVIPQLTKEVNFGTNFAQLRQVYNSLILATWYKKKIKDSILAQVYEDKNKVTSLSSPNVSVGDPQHIYQQYLKAFKKGVYNYIKEEPDPINRGVIPRKYFSGGLKLNPSRSTIFTTNNAMAARQHLDGAQIVHVDMAMASGQGVDQDMRAKLFGEIFGPVQRLPFKDRAMKAAGDQAVLSAETLQLPPNLIMDPRTGRLAFNPAARPMPLRFNFFIARHGQTFANAKGKLQGSSVGFQNVLNPYGSREAWQLAEGLIDNEKIKGGEKIVVVTSQLERSKQTAEPFIELLRGKAEVVEAKEANEINFGEYEGSFRKLSGELFKNFDAKWRAPKGESFQELLMRQYRLLEELNRRFRDRTVVLVGHGSSTSATRMLLGDQQLVDDSGHLDWLTHKIKNGGYVFFERNDQEATGVSHNQAMTAEEEKRLKAAIESTHFENVNIEGNHMDVYSIDTGPLKGDVIKVPFNKRIWLHIDDKEREERIKKFDHLASSVKENMGGIMAPFVILEDVTVNGKKFPRVVVMKRLKVFSKKTLYGLYWEKFGEYYDNESMNRGWGKRFNEQIQELITSMIRRGILYGDAIAPLNFGIDENTGQLYFIDFGNSRADPRKESFIASSYIFSLSFGGDLRDLDEMSSLWGIDSQKKFPVPDIEFPDQNIAVNPAKGGMGEEASGNKAMTTVARAQNGGIDLTAANMNVEVKKEIASSLGNAPRNDTMGGIKFHIDPAMLQQLQNTPGFVPVIVGIEPLKNLQEFLEINQ